MIPVACLELTKNYFDDKTILTPPGSFPVEKFQALTGSKKLDIVWDASRYGKIGWSNGRHIMNCQENLGLCKAQYT